MSASNKKKLRKEQEAEKLTEKQRAVVNLLKEAGSASIKETCYFNG